MGEGSGKGIGVARRERGGSAEISAVAETPRRSRGDGEGRTD
jgi:hypothetical protein